LPPDLMAQGRSLAAIGVQGIAWPRAAALEILRHLRGKAIVVLGGDVVQIEGDHPRYTYDNWRAEPAHAEPFAAFADRSVAQAEAYISGFRETGSGYCYVMVLTERLR
jgi:immunity protein 40 of polymorphic toxin system